MTQTATVTPEAVVVALGNSDRFPTGSEQFEFFSRFIGQLVEIVGEERMEQPVELGSLCDVTARFVVWLVNNDDFTGQLDDMERALVVPLFRGLAEQLEEISQDVEQLLSSMGITEAEALLGANSSLNEVAKELYRKGELTFGILLTTSPEGFIPESN